MFFSSLILFVLSFGLAYTNIYKKLKLSTNTHKDVLTLLLHIPVCIPYNMGKKEFRGQICHKT